MHLCHGWARTTPEFGAGYTDDFNQAKAIVAVCTHSLAVA